MTDGQSKIKTPSDFHRIFGLLKSTVTLTDEQLGKVADEAFAEAACARFLSLTELDPSEVGGPLKRQAARTKKIKKSKLISI